MHPLKLPKIAKDITPTGATGITVNEDKRDTSTDSGAVTKVPKLFNRFVTLPPTCTKWAVNAGIDF